MLIEFSVGNYRSFKDITTFSMLAAGLTAKDKALDENNVFAFNDEIRLLKSTAIYGANASGKSNLVRAIEFMQEFVLNSSKDSQASEPIPVEPFRLSTETSNAPSHFEMVFVVDGRRYRYGFELTSRRVIAEWLYHVPTIREAKLFERRDGKLDLPSAFKEGKDLWDKTRDNALFLSVVAQFNGPTAKSVLNWFSDLDVISGSVDLLDRTSTEEMLENHQSSGEIVRFVRSLDVGIDNIQFKSKEGSSRREARRIGKLLWPRIDPENIDIVTTHQKYDAKGEKVAIELFDIDSDESDGTRKLFGLAGPVLQALKTGKTLVVDELDARLHPLLTRAIIGLFNSNDTNPWNAQLIFATHDTNLLNKDLFRRDQIWFAEKDQFGATHLYSLAEFKVRNDASFGSDYIRGKYGAIPYLGDLTALAEPAGE